MNPLWIVVFILFVIAMLAFVQGLILLEDWFDKR